MPRHPSKQEKIKCKHCNQYTQCIEPILFKRTAENRYFIQCNCAVCMQIKQKWLNKKQIELLPDVLKTVPTGTQVFNSIPDKEKEGGILPLLPLLGLIAGGITAAASTAGAVAGSVISAKKADEEKRHHQELERLAAGKGNEGEAIKPMSKSELIERSVALLQGEGFFIGL